MMLIVRPIVWGLVIFAVLVMLQDAILWTLRQVMGKCIARKREPDLVVGHPQDPYLTRWTLARFLGCQLALHVITRSDDDRALHDHVGWHVSLIIHRGYIEHIKGRAIRRNPGDIIFRKATTPHRLELPVENAGINYAWTLWLRGPKVRDWGFHCKKGWVQHEQFSKTGCD